MSARVVSINISDKKGVRKKPVEQVVCLTRSKRCRGVRKSADGRNES